MYYLLETEHFLFRKREQKPGQGRNLPKALTVEFRSTGAPVGAAIIRSRAGSRTVSPEDMEIFCRLSRGFCRKDFQAEIVDGVKALLGCPSTETSPCTGGQPA